MSVRERKNQIFPPIKMVIVPEFYSISRFDVNSQQNNQLSCVTGKPRIGMNLEKQIEKNLNKININLFKI